MLRRSPRVLLLWAGAAVVAVATALLVGTDLATLHRRAGTFGPEVEVAVASRDLTVGVTVDGDDIGSRRVHRSQVPPGVVSPDDVEGRVIAVPVLRDGYVAQRNLTPRDRHGLDGVVPVGMRIVRAVVAGPAVGLEAGVAVDVLATFDAAAIDPEGAAYSEPTVVVARGALVIATDDGEVGEVADAAGDGVTLLVTEKEALALSYASAAAVVTIALVPPEDARAPVMDT